MMYVAKSSLRMMVFALLCGASTLAYGQEALDELRMDTDVDIDVDAGAGLEVEAVEPPPPPPDITIGDDSTDVRGRPRRTDDAYAAQGLPAGAFRLYPSLEIGSVISSNARRSNSNTKADVALRIRPELRIESNWSRHSLSGSASFEGQTFVGNSDLKSVTGSLQGALRLDVRSTTTSDFEWNYDATSTGVGDSEIPATATGSRLDHTVGLAGAVTHDFGGVSGRLRLGVSRNLYGDVDLVGGASEVNSDRNYSEVSISARASLQTGAYLQPYGEIAYEPRLYDKKRDRNGEARNSQGLRLSAGVTFDDDPVWMGDVAASFELRDYSDDSLGTVLAPGVVANVTWRPTDLTRFEFNAGVSLSETVSAGVSATQNWTLGARVAHALRENLEVSAGLSGAVERSSGQSSLSTTGTLGVNWIFNPQVVWSAGYEGTFLNSGVAGGDYNDHRLLTSIILRR